MRVVLYTHHSLFEPALSLAGALSHSHEVHLLLEVPTGGWQLANFEVARQELEPGLVPADEVLAPHYPDDVRATWRRTASFHLVVPEPRRSRDPRSIGAAASVLRWIRDLDPDVVHLDDVDVSARLAVGLALRRTAYPLVIGCHDPDPHTGERRWRLKETVRRLVLPRADAIVVHHAAGAEALRARHPRLRGPVRVVKLGAYDFLRAMGGSDTGRTGPKRPTALLFGRLTPYKGVEQLLRVAPRVAAAVPDVLFLVAGRPVAGYDVPRPPELTRGGEVELRLGYVPAEETPRLFARSTVTVCAYTDASQSGVVLTAFAFGCPVVATDVGGLPEYVEDEVNGLVVPAGDDDALAAALVRCLTDPALVQRLSAGVQESLATALSWRRSGADMVEVYEEAVAARGSRS